MASFDNKFLKKTFAKPGKLQAICDRAAKFLGAIDKPSHAGASIAEPVIVSGIKGFSYSLTAAQAVHAQTAHGASDYEEFNSTFGEYHGEARVTARAVAAGRAGNAGAAAYLRQLTEVMTSAAGSFATIAERKVLGPVGGHIGRISSNTAGADGEMSLTIEGDALNFSNGMILQAADGTGNGAPSNVRSALGYCFGVFVDGDSNGAHIHVATSEANATSRTAGIPSAWADNDYLFRNGDVADATDLSDKQIRSLQSWITLAAATDTYNGVNRSIDSRLSGCRLLAAEVAGMSILDRIQLLATAAESQGGANNATFCVLGPRTWQQLAQEAQSYGGHTFSTHTKLGIKMLTIMTCNGETSVMNSSSCSESDIWLLTLETIKMHHFDGFPALDDADGNEILRQTSTAGYTIRWHAFNSLTVSARPHHNARCPSGN